MVCVHCGSSTGVINSRHQRRSNAVWRRRQCAGCRAVFTTREATDYSAAWAVRGRQGGLRPFSRDKLLLSLHRSCQHRTDALKEAGGLAETVISKLADQASDGVIETRAIIQVTQVALNRFDKAASVHYRAFHN